MTTAHRPTYHSAVGGSEQGGNKVLVPTRQYSAKDLPGQTVLKERPKDDFSQINFKQQLLESEKINLAKKQLNASLQGKKQVKAKKM